MEKVLLAGFPKSGNTWLGYMLSCLLNAAYVEVYSCMRGIAHDVDERILGLTSGDQPGRDASGYHMVIKSHAMPVTDADKEFSKYPGLTKKVILIVRDPRDVCVSYFKFTKTYLPLKFSLKSMLMNNPHYFFYRTMKDWRKHTNAWLEKSPFIVKYESLKGDTRRCIQDILAFLDTDPAPEIIERTIDAFSFERMSKGRKPGDEDSQSFYRKGIVGDHRNHFTCVDDWIYKRLCSDTMKKLGYPAG